jgi:hypothetical protein
MRFKWPDYHRLHDLRVFFAMQVARSLRIRSRYLAMIMMPVPAWKARRTQAQLHAATRGNVRLHAADENLCCQSVARVTPVLHAATRGNVRLHAADKNLSLSCQSAARVTPVLRVS